MKGPSAVVAAAAAAVIAAAVPASRSEAYPGANCFHNCMRHTACASIARTRRVPNAAVA